MLSKQILLKISPELSTLIDRAFTEHLKKTGEYITRSKFIRKILEDHCVQSLLEIVDTKI